MRKNLVKRDIGKVSFCERFNYLSVYKRLAGENSKYYDIFSQLIEAYHTVRKEVAVLNAPVIAKRKVDQQNDQWLGEGFYFWQDHEFAVDWGPSHVCISPKKPLQYEIYRGNLKIDWINDPDVIDLVFREKDYKMFIKVVDDFGARFARNNNGAKPTLSDFNDFVADEGIWGDTRAIRFNDNPTNESKHYLKITGLPYKKRIQIAVFDLFETLSNFVRIEVRYCPPKKKNKWQWGKKG